MAKQIKSQFVCRYPEISVVYSHNRKQKSDDVFADTPKYRRYIATTANRNQMMCLQIPRNIGGI